MVDYDIEDLEPPILTVEQAVEKSSFFEVPPIVCPSQVGDFSKGMAESDHQIHSAEVLLLEVVNLFFCVFLVISLLFSTCYQDSTSITILFLYGNTNRISCTR